MMFTTLSVTAISSRVKRADNYTNDSRQWPDPTEPRPSKKPRPKGCTCDIGIKLECPVHGMHPTDPDLNNTWAFADQANPVGFPQDAPRSWQQATSKFARLTPGQRVKVVDGPESGIWGGESGVVTKSGPMPGLANGWHIVRFTPTTNYSIFHEKQLVPDQLSLDDDQGTQLFSTVAKFVTTAVVDVHVAGIKHQNERKDRPSNLISKNTTPEGVTVQGQHNQPEETHLFSTLSLSKLIQPVVDEVVVPVFDHTANHGNEHDQHANQVQWQPHSIREARRYHMHKDSSVPKNLSNPNHKHSVADVREASQILRAALKRIARLGHL